MLRELLLSASILLSVALLAQSQEEFVRFNGKVFSQKDSAAVSDISFLYEKLPYYDDMGIAKSDVDGFFEFYLIRDLDYTITMSSKGYITQSVDVSMKANDKDLQIERVFYLEPVPDADEPEVITLDNLIFARGSDRITASSFGELDQLVEWLDGRPTMIIQLEGHTDFAGNADANMRLSQARVEAVKKYLIKNGTKKSRVLTKAFGGTQPLFTERTDEAKTKNRRVEVRVISK